MGEDIVVETRLSEEVGAVFADEPGLSNALLNIAINARAAMPGGGRLVVSAAARCVDEELSVGADVLPAGDYVEIAVSDTGCGMTAEVLEHAFEPFFTTKGVGEGQRVGAEHGARLRVAVGRDGEPQ